MIGEYKIHRRGGGVERSHALIYIFGGSINWLNIFVGIWQNLPELNANV